MKIKVKGLVQDVNFRYYTREMAEKLSIVGHVTNVDGDKVEIIAEGEKENLEELINWSGQGPKYAQVKNEEVDWQEPTGEFNEFKIKY